MAVQQGANRRQRHRASQCLLKIVFDLTDHQNATLAGLLQKRLEYSSLFLHSEILPAPPSARRNGAIAYRFSLDESVALLANPADLQARHLSGLLQAHRKSQWQNHRLGLAQLLDSYSVSDDLHRTINNFFPASDSGHSQILGGLDSYYGSIDMEIELQDLQDL